VLALAAAAHGGWGGVLPAALMLAAVYAAYEFGYLVNDTVVVEREAAPTLRLDEDLRLWMRARLELALVVRAVIGLGCLAAWLALTPSPQPLAVAAGWLALWPCFALYNRWRGRITIGLHFVLVSLRFVLPILAAAGPGSVGAGWIVLLLVLYPAPNAYEAAWKARYGLPGLKRAFGHEDRFRVTWYLALLLAGLVWTIATPATPSHQLFIAACGYFLIQRILAWLIRRDVQDVTPRKRP
jgi:hypothetical protein